MKAQLLATTALVFAISHAEAACVGSSGTPFNCDSAASFTAADLLLGGSNTSPTTGKSVRYTGQQLLDFVTPFIPVVPTAPLLSGSGGHLLAVALSPRLSNAGGTLDLAALLTAGSVGGGTIIPTITFDLFGRITSAGTTVLGSAALANTGTAGAVLGLLNAGLVYSGNDQFTGGLEIGTPTGGMPAAGTINAIAVDVGGVPVLTGNQTITLSGDIAGSGTTAIITTLPSIVAGGTFGGTGSLISTLILNNKGQVTGATGAPAAGGLAGAGIAINSGTITTTESILPRVGATFTAGTADASALTTFSTIVAVTVPQAGTAFPANQWAEYLNLSSAGLVTFTPTTSTINGKATWEIQPYQSVKLISDGTNYVAETGTTLHMLTGNALTSRIPDNGIVGGNARGTNSLDIQPYGAQSAATQVASGGSSTALGSRITASGTQSVGMGNNNIVAGSFSVAGGFNNTVSATSGASFGSTNTIAVAASGGSIMGSGNTVSGNVSTAVGSGNNVGGATSAAMGSANTLTAVSDSYAYGDNLTDRGNQGALVTGNAGRNYQDERYVFTNATSGSAAVQLTTDGSGVGGSAGGVAALGNNSAMAFTAECIVLDLTTKQVATYSQALSVINRGTAAATTAMSASNPAMAAGPTIGAAFTLAAAPAITADITHGGFTITETPPVANTDTLHSSCRIRPLYQF